MLGFALTVPILLLVSMATLEVGLQFFNVTTVRSAVEEAAREASLQRNNPLADEAIFELIEERTGHLSGDVVGVVVFRVDSFSDSMHPNCEHFSVNEVCSHWAVTTPNVNDSYQPVSNGYAPSMREEGDIVGVHILFDHISPTNIVGSSSFAAFSTEIVEAGL